MVYTIVLFVSCVKLFTIGRIEVSLTLFCLLAFTYSLLFMCVCMFYFLFVGSMQVKLGKNLLQTKVVSDNITAI